jgi:hypothetical protein
MSHMCTLMPTLICVVRLSMFIYEVWVQNAFTVLVGMLYMKLMRIHVPGACYFCKTLYLCLLSVSACRMSEISRELETMITSVLSLGGTISLSTCMSLPPYCFLISNPVELLTGL